MQLVFIGFVFWLSGVAGLTYEILWFRMLSTAFGATGPALAATTGAFMAGLGLGSRLVSGVADTVKRPVRWYAALELGLAGYAFFMPQLIESVNAVYRNQITSNQTSLMMVVTQFILLFALLVIPTALMGATLPLMCRALIDRDATLGRKFAWLYGMNTLGAACGAMLTGFFLIQAFGVQMTSGIAVSINVAAAILALMIRTGRRGDWNAAPVDVQPSNVVTPSSSRSKPAFHKSILLSVFVCGFVGLACQNLWIRCLLFGFDRLKNTTYSLSSVLTVTLLALVLGTALSSWFVDRTANRNRLLGWIMAALGASIAASVAVLMFSPGLQDIVDPDTLRVDFGHAVTSVILRTLYVIGIPCALLGMAMPVAVRCLGDSAGIGRQVGRVYALNTLGAVLGAMFAAFVFPVAFGLLPSILISAGLTLAAAAALLYDRGGIRIGLLSCSAVLCIIAILTPAQVWWLQSLRDGESIVALRDGVSGTVCVIENDRGERRICVDDVPVAGTSNIMQTDQKCLAHWSMMLAERPKKALTVGFGSGGASYSFLLHDTLQELHCVEISPDVPRMAKYLTDANHGLMENRDPRYRVIFEDARAYLAATNDQYDVIVSDCTDLRYRSSANLYDLEYFQLCRSRMTEGGCTTIWMPLGGLSQSAFKMTLNTFRTVFPEMTVHYLHNRWTHYVLLIGAKGSPQFQLDDVRRMLGEDDVRADMAEIGMTDPFKIVATFLTSGTALDRVLQDASLNTEDRPRLEFEVPRSDMGPWSAQKNLDFLRLHRGSILDVLSTETSPEDVESAMHYHEAARHILTAQAAARTFQYEVAAREYLLARTLTPDDRAIEHALEFPELIKISANGQPTASLMLGRVQQLKGNTAEALKLIELYEAQMLELQSRESQGQKGWLQQAQQWKTTSEIWKKSLRKTIDRSANMTSDQ